LPENLRLSGPDVGAHSLKGVGVAFPGRPGENIRRGNQLCIHQARLLDGIQVLSLQESAANSSSPQVNVGFGPIRDLLVDYNVRQVKTTPRLQGPENFRKHPVLVRAQINDTIGYDYIHRFVINRQFLNEPFAELNLAQAHALSGGPGLFQHGVGHVHANDLALGADKICCNKAVEASPGAYIQHSLTSLNCAQGEGIAYPGKGLHGLRRHGIYQFHRVAQHLRQRAAMMEMEGLVWTRSNFGVFMLHFSSQDLYIRRNLGSHNHLQLHSGFLEMTAIIGIHTPEVNIYLIMLGIYLRIS
jgi:hypothetical protein